MKRIVLYFTVLLLGAQIAFAQDDMSSHAKHAVELGWQYFNRGDADTALKRFNQARILDKTFAPAYFGTAYVLSTQGKLDEAVDYYQKTIELEPAFPHSYSNLGLALIYMGKKEDAYKYLQKAIQLAPEDGDVNINMAVWYFESGRYTEAWKHVKAARRYGAKVKDTFIEDLSSKMQEPN